MIHREGEIPWIRNLISRCRESETAPFLKQLGSVWAQHTVHADEPIAKPTRTDTTGPAGKSACASVSTHRFQPDFRHSPTPPGSHMEE